VRRPTIVQAAVVFLTWELVALRFFPTLTWTHLSHSPQGIPAWIFWAWLGIHLARGEKRSVLRRLITLATTQEGRQAA
jgi:hypothetical protein